MRRRRSFAARPRRRRSGSPPRPRRRKMRPHRSGPGKRNFRRPPARLPPPRPSAPRASARSARRRQSCGGWRTSACRRLSSVTASWRSRASTRRSPRPPLRLPKPRPYRLSVSGPRRRPKAPVPTARETERRARGPFEQSERALDALQAEARMLAELLDAENATRFPPLFNSLDVTPGYEKALAAALGDDLDASLDAEAPVHWGAAPAGEADPVAARRRGAARRFRARAGEPAPPSPPDRRRCGRCCSGAPAAACDRAAARHRRRRAVALGRTMRRGRAPLRRAPAGLSSAPACGVVARGADAGAGRGR